MNYRLLIINVALAPLGAAVAGATQFIPLGFPPGLSSSAAEGISSNGSFVVGFGWSVETRPQAFRWSESSGFQTLGDLPGGADYSVAADASADGGVVIGSSLGNAHAADALEAFRWSESGGIEGLGVLPGDDTSSAAAVSGDGSIVVGASYVGTADTDEAFRWTEASGMQGLGFLPGMNGSQAWDISADGRVIVGRTYSTLDDSEQAFRWTQADGMQGLGVLPGDSHSQALGASVDGSVIVGSSGSTADGLFEAFRWTDGIGMEALGTLPGYDQVGGTKVSADGAVVVGTALRDPPQPGTGNAIAIVWTEADGMRSLADVLADRGVHLGGWRLRLALAVSDDGRSIVGRGVNPFGREEGWLVRLTPVPEPTTLTIVATCLMGVLCIARRRPRTASSRA